MATIAEQLTSLANTKTAIKEAIVAKGVSVADDTPFSGYATKIGEIGETVEETKFGASLDTFIGDVVNGVLQAPTAQTALNFAGVTEIGTEALQYAFYSNTGLTSVDLSSVQSVGSSGLASAFYGCTGITGALDLSSLQTVGSSGLASAFRECSGITSVDLSSLQSVDGFTGLQFAFYRCTGLTSVDLSSLQSVGSSGLQQTFVTTRLTTISFPSLTSVQSNGFSNTFSSNTALTEIHFRADMQATIEAQSGYANKFGAPATCTIYFDL